MGGDSAAESSSSSFSGSSMFNNSQHADVLHATADTPEAKAKLVEELKYRGNASFKAQRYQEAEVLYGRAIEHDNTIAALFGNRSMTRACMGKFDDALKDADAAVQADPQWVKGYFRRGTAHAGLHHYDDAEASFKKVLELDATNKDAKKQLARLPKLQEAHAAKEAKNKAQKDRSDAEAKEVQDKLAGTKIVSPSAAVPQPKPKPKPIQQKSAEEEEEEAADIARGYKIMADGRKTSYFTKELSAEDKALLAKTQGSRAVDATAVEMDKKLSEAGVSAWNVAGTFEEKDMGGWARTYLHDLLLDVKVPVQLLDGDGDEQSYNVCVTELQDMEGDATVTFTRGKKRHIFNFEFGCVWKIKGDGSHDGVTGSLYFPDVNGDVVVSAADCDVEVDLRWSNSGSIGKENQRTMKSLLLNEGERGVLGAIRRAICTFAMEFRSRS